MFVKESFECSMGDTLAFTTMSTVMSSSETKTEPQKAPKVFVKGSQKASKKLISHRLVIGVHEPPSLSQILTRLRSIDAKNGPFDAVCMCGTALHDQMDLDDFRSFISTTISFQLYITGPAIPSALKRAVPDTESGAVMKLGSQIVFIPHNTVHTSANLTVASVHPTEEAVSIQTDQRIDILLSTTVPQGIEKQSARPYPKTEGPTSLTLAQWMEAQAPRYTFVSGAEMRFYEREPFAVQGPGRDVRVVRYLSLGAYGNQAKERWFYAMTLQHASQPVQGCTSSPFAPRVEKSIASLPGFMPAGSTTQKPPKVRRGGPIEEEVIPNYRFAGVAGSVKRTKFDDPSTYAQHPADARQSRRKGKQHHQPITSLSLSL